MHARVQRMHSRQLLYCVARQAEGDLLVIFVYILNLFWETAETFRGL